MAPATTAQSIQAEAERLARQIVLRLEAAEDALRDAWDGSGPVQHIVVDDLLAPADATAIAAGMPRPEALHLKRSLRERKRVGVDIDRYDPIVGGILLAFQQPSVIEVVARITKLAEMRADPSLYASGISVMGRGDFLNPHLDNSHDGDQVLYRAVNLLYYVSPDWDPASGGNLELWDPSLRSREIVACRFNRLAVMATNQASWHSVQRVVADAPRMCISNYYFSPSPPGGVAYRNVTSFRGRPEEPLKRVLLWLDSHALNAVGRVAPGLLKRNRHRRRAN
jgi:Rps23 Pro-64 3,4-dihydroxylase Tpa1-like proline 4-hydroxylase